MDVNSSWLQAEATLLEAIQLFDRTERDMVVVVDLDHRLLGGLTQADIRRALIEGAQLSSPVRTLVRQDLPVLIASGGGIGLEQASVPRGLLQGTSPTDLENVPPFPYVTVVDEAGCPIDLIVNSAWPRRTRHVVVAGGAGYIGSTLVHRLLAAGHRVTVVDRFLYGADALDDVREHPRLTIVEADTRHIDQLAPVVAEADAIVHLAELVGDPLCAQDPLRTMEINLMATANLVNLAARLQIDRFIYISSCSVYGSSADPDELLTEQSGLAPLSIYAKTKILAEQTIRRLEHGNFSPCIFRLGTVFGMSPRPRFDLVVNTLTAQAVQHGQISVFGGEQWRPHVHVQDVARAIELALDAPLHRVAGQVLNIIGENLTIGALGEQVAQEVEGTQVITGELGADRRDYRVSGCRAQEVLEFTPVWQVRDGIVEIRDALRSGRVTDYQRAIYSNIRALAGTRL